MKKNMFKRSALLALTLILILQPTATFCKKNRGFAHYLGKHPVLTTMTGLTATVLAIFVAKQYFFPKAVRNEGELIMPEKDEEKLTKEDNKNKDVLNSIDTSEIVEGKNIDKKQSGWLMSKLSSWFPGWFAKKEIKDENDSDTSSTNSDDDEDTIISDMKKIITNDLKNDDNDENQQKIKTNNTRTVIETFVNLTTNSDKNTNETNNQQVDNNTNNLYTKILSNDSIEQKNMFENDKLNKNFEGTYQLNQALINQNNLNMDDPNAKQIYPNPNIITEN